VDPPSPISTKWPPGDHQLTRANIVRVTPSCHHWHMTRFSRGWDVECNLIKDSGTCSPFHFTIICNISPRPIAYGMRSRVDEAPGPKTPPPTPVLGEWECQGDRTEDRSCSIRSNRLQRTTLSSDTGLPRARPAPSRACAKVGARPSYPAISRMPWALQGLALTLGVRHRFMPDRRATRDQLTAR